ncbi:hypothetical protein DFH06DRAFT_1387576 [Mycena polygramma]|nr:hypothetical protein DFH06DRAFT_1387576 [Mycena polygramma]
MWSTVGTSSYTRGTETDTTFTSVAAQAVDDTHAAWRSVMESLHLSTVLRLSRDVVAAPKMGHTTTPTSDALVMAAFTLNNALQPPTQILVVYLTSPTRASNVFVGQIPTQIPDAILRSEPATLVGSPRSRRLPYSHHQPDDFRTVQRTMTTRAAQPQPHFSVVDWHADHPHYGDERKALPSASHLREPAHPIPARRRRPDFRRPSEPDQVSLFCHGRLGSNVTAQTIVAGGVNDQEHGPNTYPAVWRRVFFRPLHYRQPSHPKSHPPAKLPGLTTEHSYRVQEDIAPWFYAQWLRRSDVGATPLNAGVHAGRSSGRIGGSFVARRGGVVHARRHTGTASPDVLL